MLVEGEEVSLMMVPAKLSLLILVAASSASKVTLDLDLLRVRRPKVIEKSSHTGRLGDLRPDLLGVSSLRRGDGVTAVAPKQASRSAGEIAQVPLLPRRGLLGELRVGRSRKSI
uniref:Uncharacterized protein n=1 Tax=Chrysotila carterae TaxID=13221 RepID=A0A7S4C098_CHRCT|mmetsp:Transcript_2685/g.5705  ORF Transcript_2685/g.5705 Transcript_2685/m.5705 type:complete len:114 (-) Transcript_2685:738-1079(-)|eukprot:2692862-Pleurochrysis_carterae.AAC.2